MGGLEVNQLVDQRQNLSQIMVITGHVTNPKNGNGDPVIMLNMGIQEIILVNKCQVKITIMAKTVISSVLHPERREVACMKFLHLLENTSRKKIRRGIKKEIGI